MNQEKQLLNSSASVYAMRPRLRRLQIIASLVFIVFSIAMTILLVLRQNDRMFEYLFWIGGIAVWCYAIWYTLSAELIINSQLIQFHAGLSTTKADWSEIDSLGMEASGPVLYVQDSDQSQNSNSAKKNRRRKKLPLYLFMSDWKTKQDWQSDPVGQDVLKHVPWVLKTKE